MTEKIKDFKEIADSKLDTCNKHWEAGNLDAEVAYNLLKKTLNQLRIIKKLESQVAELLAEKANARFINGTADELHLDILECDAVKSAKGMDKIYVINQINDCLLSKFPEQEKAIKKACIKSRLQVL